MTERKKGLVMSAFPDGEVTVMTPQGEFLNIPWPRSALPEVGSEIEFVPPVVKKSIFRQKYFAALAASVILFLLAMPLWMGMILPGPRQIVAYISVDINPSIELGINYQGKVLEATGLNDDGVKLLQDLDLAKLPVNEAIRLITAEAVKENYLTPDKENTVLITVSSEKKLPEQARNLEQQVKTVLEQERIPAQADSIEVPMEIRTQAKMEQVSSGKYVVLMEAVEQGLNLTLEDIKNNSIVKAVKDAGGIPGQLISQAQKDRDKIREIYNSFQEKVKAQAHDREALNPQPGKQQDELKNKELKNEEKGSKKNKKDNNGVKYPGNNIPGNIDEKNQGNKPPSVQRPEPHKDKSDNSDNKDEADKKNDNRPAEKPKDDDKKKENGNANSSQGNKNKSPGSSSGKK